MSSFKKLGEGTYGCVVKPAVGCDDEVKPGEFVAKYTSDVKAEKKGYELMTKADPLHDFTMGLVEDCPVTSKDQMVMDDNCDDSSAGYKFISREGQPLQLVQRGGFNEYFKDILGLFNPLIRGIEKMVDKQVIHADIKPANIVIKDGKLYLIDFGLSTTFKEMISDMGFYGQPYYFWPGDLFFMANSAESNLEEWNRKRMADNSQPGLFPLTEEAVEVFKNSLLEEKLKMRILKTFDLYSLAVTMYRIFRGLGYTFPFPNDHANTFFKHTCHPDIRERWLPSQAVEYAESVFRSLP